MATACCAHRGEGLIRPWSTIYSCSSPEMDSEETKSSNIPESTAPTEAQLPAPQEQQAEEQKHQQAQSQTEEHEHQQEQSLVQELEPQQQQTEEQEHQEELSQVEIESAKVLP